MLAYGKGSANNARHSQPCGDTIHMFVRIQICAVLGNCVVHNDPQQRHHFCRAGVFHWDLRLSSVFTFCSSVVSLIMIRGSVNTLGNSGLSDRQPCILLNHLNAPLSSSLIVVLWPCTQDTDAVHDS